MLHFLPKLNDIVIFSLHKNKFYMSIAEQTQKVNRAEKEAKALKCTKDLVLWEWTVYNMTSNYFDFKEGFYGYQCDQRCEICRRQ